MISDVPLGCFLSGGIDSSLIASLMQAESITPINTFTIGVNNSEIDEAKNARKIADHLGTNHTELYLNQNQIIDIIPRALELYGEPFADSSQIPTLLVSMMAKKHVSVALTGDAGDELFGATIDIVLQTSIGKKFIHYLSLSENQFTKIGKSYPFIVAILKKINANKSIEAFDLKLQKFFSSLHSKDGYELYDRLSSCEGYNQIIVDSHEPNPSKIENDSNFSDIERMMLKDTIEYLPNDILVKVDRAAMSQSLETRRHSSIINCLNCYGPSHKNIK